MKLNEDLVSYSHGRFQHLILYRLYKTYKKALTFSIQGFKAVQKVAGLEFIASNNMVKKVGYI